MRKLKRISVFLFLFIIAFTAGVFFEKLMNSFYPNNNDSAKTEPIAEVVYEKENYNPAIQNEELISADTKLNIMPTKYIGLNRKRFIEEMDIYEISPALSDIKKGFKSLLVLSFSSKEVTLQKNYMVNNSNMHFFMVSKDNKVVVYYEDMETVFLKTEIEVNHLPENVRLEILNKKYFQTEEELYNFLESYSS